MARFIKVEDNTLTHLDIERNRVGSDGGAALLDALSTTTRIVSCNIVYGNPISNKMARVFEVELEFLHLSASKSECTLECSAFLLNF